jgi:hypothetical protein
MVQRHGGREVRVQGLAGRELSAGQAGRELAVAGTSRWGVDGGGGDY